jgi:hypothetical protein
MKEFFIGALFAVVLCIVGFYSYQAGTQKSKTEIPIIPTPSQTLVGNDRDEHGCIGSAGYSWCGFKQKCIRSWEESCSAETVTPVVPTVDETKELIKALRVALVTKQGQSANNLNITVSKIIGDFATGEASASGGGGIWFAAKVNNNWQLVWDGNGIVFCTDLSNYPNFPNSLIPECYDKATDKMIKR